MLILPAIDLLAGRCARLLRGDFAAATVYAEDPAAMAAALAAAGARALHVVDLDGARAGRPVHAKALAAIVDACGVPVQAGGGLRSFEDLETVLARGVWRAILGTAALRDAAWVVEAVRRHGADRLCVAVDVRDGRVFDSGWREGLTEPLDVVLERLAEAGVRALLVTSIARDGALTGPDLELYDRLLGAPFEITAAGGVAEVEDLRALARLGLAGAVVGRALYGGRIALADLGPVSAELAEVTSSGGKTHPTRAGGPAA